MEKYSIVSARFGDETREQVRKIIREINNLLKDRMRYAPRPY